MPNCKKCDNKTGMFESWNYSGMCKTCWKKEADSKKNEHVRKADILIGTLGGESMSTMRRLMDVGMQMEGFTKATWLGIGDLFITQTALIYVPFNKCELVNLPYALTGIVGSVHNSIEIRRATKQANKTRLSFNDSLESMLQSQEYTAINKPDITTVVCDHESGIVEINQDNQKTVLLVLRHKKRKEEFESISEDLISLMKPQ